MKRQGYLGWNTRINVFDNNYRISTDGSSHAWETFDTGLTKLPTYDVAIQGFATTVNDPSNNDCGSNGYSWRPGSGWAANKAYCNANIDLPEGFVFEYFEQNTMVPMHLTGCTLEEWVQWH